ncbi:unnamed protein product [Aphanomyces euteiches]
MEPVTVIQPYSGQVTKRSPNAVYAWIANVGNLKRLVEAGFGDTTSTRHIPGTRAVERSMSQKPAKLSNPVRNHHPLPFDVAGIMDWLRSCPPRSVTTNQLADVMEADTADFKKKTIQANKVGAQEGERVMPQLPHCCISNNDLAERNTWNEQLALEIQQHEVYEAFK